MPLSNAAMTKPEIEPSREISVLLEVMKRLRQGCPWDRAQTFATIAPYTVEEAYEVAASHRGPRLTSPCPTNWAIFCSRSCFMPAWPRKPACSTSAMWSRPSPPR